MIPDRGLSKKTGDLTILRYQEMPMIPKARSVETAKIVQKNAGLPPAKTLPKKTVKRGPDKKPRIKPMSGQMIAVNLPRLKEQAKALFCDGPLTIQQISERRDSTYSATAIAMRLWAKRGVVRVVGMSGKAKLWSRA